MNSVDSSLGYSNYGAVTSERSTWMVRARPGTARVPYTSANTVRAALRSPARWHGQPYQQFTGYLPRIGRQRHGKVGTGRSGNMTGGLNVGWYGTGSLQIDSGEVGHQRQGLRRRVGRRRRHDPGDRAGVTHGYLTNTLYLGYQNTGSMRIDDGGSVNGTDVEVAYGDGSNGEVTVTGPALCWNLSGSLQVGRSGNGTLLIEDGGPCDQRQWTDRPTMPILSAR